MAIARKAERLYFREELSPFDIAYRLGLPIRFVFSILRELAEDFQAVRESGIHEGLVLIFDPDHPRAQNGYVPEHVVMLEKKLGRILKPEEEVAHLNGITSDNRPENLTLKKAAPALPEFNLEACYDKLRKKRRRRPSLREFAHYLGLKPSTLQSRVGLWSRFVQERALPRLSVPQRRTRSDEELFSILDIPEPVCYSVIHGKTRKT